MNPLISCIMPTRERPQFVLQAVAYVLRQDYSNLELIIIDDSARSLRNTLPHDPRIRYTHSRRLFSIGQKRNLACQQARGELIAHWDDDDWYAPQRLSHQVQPLLAGTADISGLETAGFLDIQRWQGWRLTPELHTQMFVAGVHGATLMYWRGLWGSLGRFPDSSLGEDAVFLNLAQSRGARVAQVAHAGCFVYLRHPNNTWRFEPGSHLNPAGWLPVNPDDLIPAEDRGFYATLR
jgi:glycosyltransferase involved in cell wall biosynthesis